MSLPGRRLWKEPVPGAGKNPPERESELGKTPAGPDPASLSVTRGIPLPFTSSSWLPGKQLEACRVEKAQRSVKLLLRNRQSTATGDSEFNARKQIEREKTLQWTTYGDRACWKLGNLFNIQRKMCGKHNPLPTRLCFQVSFVLGPVFPLTNHKRGI